MRKSKKEAKQNQNHFKIKKTKIWKCAVTWRSTMKLEISSEFTDQQEVEVAVMQAWKKNKSRGEGILKK